MPQASITGRLPGCPSHRAGSSKCKINSSNAHRPPSLALFNVGDATAEVKTPLAAYGLSRAEYRMRKPWQRKDVGRGSAIEETIAPHDCALLELR